MDLVKNYCYLTDNNNNHHHHHLKQSNKNKSLVQKNNNDINFKEDLNINNNYNNNAD